MGVSLRRMARAVIRTSISAENIINQSFNQSLCLNSTHLCLISQGISLMMWIVHYVSQWTATHGGREYKILMKYSLCMSKQMCVFLLWGFLESLEFTPQKMNLPSVLGHYIPASFPVFQGWRSIQQGNIHSFAIFLKLKSWKEKSHKKHKRIFKRE